MTTPLIDGETPERILGPAIRINGDVTWAPIPASHYTVSQRMREDGHIAPLKGEQGFVTAALRFVTRDEAYAIAAAAGQIVSHTPNPDSGLSLFSEDLWCENLYAKTEATNA